MAKNMVNKLKNWAQIEEGYADEYETSNMDDLKDYSGSAAKVFNTIFMKEEDDYKIIVKCLSKGSACTVNLSSLSKEDALATIYRIEGVIQAVKGSLIKITPDVIQLLPSGFVIRTFNNEENEK